MNSVRNRLVAACAVSIMSHSVLLACLRPAATTSSGNVSARTLLVRMLPAATAAPLEVPPSETVVSNRDSSTQPVASSAQKAEFGGAAQPRLARGGDRIRGDLPSNADTARDAVPIAKTVAASGPASPAATQREEPPRVRPSDYLLAARLDPGPRPLHDIEPAFPPEAGLQDGTVVLRILISESGIVDDVTVLSATPKGFFEKSALEAFAAAQFSPGMVLGTAVKSQMTIEVSFTPFNRGAAVSGRTY